ncbi:Zinc-binding dehydrogenase family protein [Corynebacterium glyciniphilum AJ 3170]|uniref:Zinc-binding dehydrogenase family protein n=1 Tax=Corynebacterium glyciniphilum AJ 3170 TaxID=1404245 RepID=X5DVQ1_9CORY|nr:zinc-binding dehydrogenase [Corynebacterium glyciniphilum]AHW65404.1 Zinc-binding dehydrogenase family protein [Corynebacterium glyciniphilum AJ 3170]
MWILKQPGPCEFTRYDVDVPTSEELGDGDVLLEFLFGSICGSDIPKYRGIMDPDNPYTGNPGVPLHEIVGRVALSRSSRFRTGDRVVGIVEESRGLSEYIVDPDKYLASVPESLTDREAVIMQPVATVLSSYSRVRSLAGKRVAVLGLGPLGVLFTHIARSLGAAYVVGVDRIDRADIREQFGMDETVTVESRQWAQSLADDERPDLVIDAIGHREEIVADAVTAARPGGEVLVYGLPEDWYAFPMRAFFRKGLTMAAGATQSWDTYLAAAGDYVVAHGDLRRGYITHAFPIAQVSEAFELYATPARSRLKVGLTPDGAGA